MSKKKNPLSDAQYQRHIARAYVLLPAAFFAQAVLYGLAVICSTLAFWGWETGLLFSLLAFTFGFWFTHTTRDYLQELRLLSRRKHFEEQELARISRLMQRVRTPHAAARPLSDCAAHSARLSGD